MHIRTHATGTSKITCSPDHGMPQRSFIYKGAQTTRTLVYGHKSVISFLSMRFLSAVHLGQNEKVLGKWRRHHV